MKIFRCILGMGRCVGKPGRTADIRTVEKAHGQMGKREYHQTTDIGWLYQKKEWKGIKSIGMEEKTIKDEKGERKEYRYYISSLGPDIETFKRAVRGHWSVESMHWHLDVTFREDANTTLDKQAAQRKWSLSILKMIEIMKPGLSMRKKWYAINLRPIKYLEEVLSFLKIRKHSCVCRGGGWR